LATFTKRKISKPKKVKTQSQRRCSVPGGADNIEELDLRTNPFQEGGSDGGPP